MVLADAYPYICRPQRVHTLWTLSLVVPRHTRIDRAPSILRTFGFLYYRVKKTLFITLMVAVLGLGVASSTSAKVYAGCVNWMHSLPIFAAISSST